MLLLGIGFIFALDQTRYRLLLVTRGVVHNSELQWARMSGICQEYGDEYYFLSDAAYGARSTVNEWT